MAVSERQFTLLNEMGIQLWQRSSLIRSPTAITTTTSEDVQIPVEQAPTTHKAHLDFQQLTKTSLFIDIINSLSISISDVTCLNNVLNLGLISWQFNDSNDTSAISLKNNLLITPQLSIIAQSAQLKRQLWQTIQTQDIS